MATEITEKDLETYERLQPFFDRVDDWYERRLPHLVLPLGVIGVILLACIPANAFLADGFGFLRACLVSLLGVIAGCALPYLLIALVRCCIPALRRIDSVRNQAKSRQALRREAERRVYIRRRRTVDPELRAYYHRIARRVARSSTAHSRAAHSPATPPSQLQTSMPIVSASRQSLSTQVRTADHQAWVIDRVFAGIAPGEDRGMGGTGS